jgi:hypothetical protein
LRFETKSIAVPEFRGAEAPLLALGNPTPTTPVFDRNKSAIVGISCGEEAGQPTVSYC